MLIFTIVLFIALVVIAIVWTDNDPNTTPTNLYITFVIAGALIIYFIIGATDAIYIAKVPTTSKTEVVSMYGKVIVRIQNKEYYLLDNVKYPVSKLEEAPNWYIYQTYFGTKYCKPCYK